MPKKMPQSRLVKKMVNEYADLIIIEDGGLNYEESCYRMSERIMETMEYDQLEFTFGKAFGSVQECFDFVAKKIPGLCEAMIEFAEYNGLTDDEL